MIDEKLSCLDWFLTVSRCQRLDNQILQLHYGWVGQGNAVTCRRRSFVRFPWMRWLEQRDFLEFVMECHQTTDVREIYVCTYI